MRPLIRNVAVVAAIVLVGLSAFAGGWFLESSQRTGPSSVPALWIVGAGSLAPILPTFAAAFVSATPNVTDPVSAQLYEGSGTAASSLAGGHQPYDVFVAADFRTIPTVLEPPASTVAAWEVAFASDPMVLAYNATDPTLSGLNGGNWWTKIVQPGVLLGTPNASADPLGYNAIFTLELQDALAGLGGSLYSHFFTGTEGALAGPTSATKYVSENVASTALSSGEVDAFLIYRSYAVADHLSYVNLTGSVDLGGTTSANVSQYQTASTTILSGSSQKVVEGAPVLFALTVPATARDTALGTQFAAYLLSNASAPRWGSYGFDPLPVEWSDHPSALPWELTGSPPSGVAPFPSYLSALL